MHAPTKNSFEYAKWQHSERQYKEMVGPSVLKAFPNIKFKYTDDRDIGSRANAAGEIRDACKHVTTMLNIAFTMVAVFTFFMYIGEYLSTDFGIRMLIALLASFVVGFAEGYFYVAYVLLVEDKDVNRKKRWVHKIRPSESKKND